MAGCECLSKKNPHYEAAQVCLCLVGFAVSIFAPCEEHLVFIERSVKKYLTYTAFHHFKNVMEGLSMEIVNRNAKFQALLLICIMTNEELDSSR
jgi:hypothetical protein